MSAEGAPLPPPTGEAIVPALQYGGNVYMNVVTRGTEENPQYWAVDIYGKLHRVTNEAGKGFLLTAQQETADEMRAKNPKNNHNNRKVVEGDSDSAQPEGAPLPPPAPRPSLDEVFGAPVALKAPSPFEQVPSGPAKTTEQMRAEGYESWAMTEPATAAMVEELHVNDVFGVRSKADSLDALRASYQLETDAALARGETPRDFQSFVRELHDFRAKHAEVARVAAAAAPRPPEAASAPASPSKTPEKIAEEARIAQLKGDIAIIIRKDIPTLLPKDVLDDPVMFEEALQSKFAAEASLLPAGTTYEQWLTATKYNFETFVDKAIHKSTEILSMGSINELLRGKDHDEIVAYYETYKQSCIDSGMSADDVPSLKRWLEDVQANEEANRVVESRLSPEQRAKFDRIVDLVLESKDPLLINTYKGMGREEIFDAVISQYGDTAGVSIGVLDGILDNNIMKLEESAASHSEKKEFEITDVFGEGHGSIGHERLLTRKRALALIGSLALGFAAQRHQGVHNMVSQLTYKTPLVPTVDLGQGISKWSNRLIQFNMYATPLYLGAIMSAQKMARPFARRKYAREMIESIDEGDVIVERAEDSSDAGFRRVVSVDKANPDGIIEFQILTEDLKVDDRYHYNEENRTIKMLLSDYQDMLRRKQNFGRFANLTKNEAHHGHSEGVHAKHLGEAERFIEEIIADGIKPEGLIHMGQPLVFDRYDAVTDTFSYIRQDRVRLTYERDELLHKLVRSIADEIVTNIEAVQEIPDLTRSQKVRRAVGNATASVRGLRPVSRARQGASRRMGELRTSFAQAFADRGEERKLRRQRVTDTIDHLRTGRQLYLGVDTGRVEFTKVARDRSGQIASATYRTESGKEVVITGTALRKRIEDINRVSTRKTRYARVTGRVSKVVARGAVVRSELRAARLDLQQPRGAVGDLPGKGLDKLGDLEVKISKDSAKKSRERSESAARTISGLSAGSMLRGVEGGRPCEVISVERKNGKVVSVVYRSSTGRPKAISADRLQKILGHEISVKRRVARGSIQSGRTVVRVPARIAWASTKAVGRGANLTFDNPDLAARADDIFDAAESRTDGFVGLSFVKRGEGQRKVVGVNPSGRLVIELESGGTTTMSPDGFREYLLRTDHTLENIRFE